ncbi:MULTISPECIES: deoxyribose-phosphate aldolase [unclassified Oceanispirochaeta]|uniref:deoxyribose-phosphate aldolase n=1 Tax=unclassified Oceanispirochaeta TaxID=2635722 RepID=UPI000E08FA2C|nr:MULTISPECIES: deoxyribose-phosphate aldolase [unclassified Oceanispirochaeta]MBF9016338.1 deoxyribose-phosphate aldolase [Oceanispirochaeta sp. M2]NPD72800.1 deoxyribose-phosphate aldolase [Oceanispirochaeta sp. M1]RDG31644.1 deoxyribose-phosphate aldolase [Oceanispirochaeta sp. M1]
MAISVKDLAKMIDHSLLHPTMTDDIIREGCELAKKYDTASVCLKPYSVKEAAAFLKGTDVKVGSVIGFPHGNSTTAIKVAETEQACRDGAVEIDMVINIGKALGGDFDFVQDEMHQVKDAADRGGAILKVIFENDYLEEDTIARLCEICNAVDVAFVKTSSGYGFVKQENGMYSYKGATAPHLKLMRKVTAHHIEVKAAGGVRTLRDLLYVRSLGVSRIGATATAAILDEAAAVLASGKTLEEITPTDAEIGGGY